MNAELLFDHPERSSLAASAPLDVVVIGGGQAGLAVGYYLQQRGLRFAIFDSATRIGDTWRRRWDSLRLFTPARFDALPGLPLPFAANTFPSKDELADYLEAYASHFVLPVKLGVRVERVVKSGDSFLLHTSAGLFSAKQVVVAMSPYQVPKMPVLSARVRADITQLHSSQYRGPAQLPPGPVLIVGAGNSGAEIALDLARAGRSPIALAGRDTGHVPFAIDGLLSRLVLSWFVLRVVFHHLLTIRTPLGRRARQRLRGRGAPLVRAKPRDLQRAGVRRVGRVVGVERGLLRVEGGELLEPRSVIWATGFQAEFSWLELPVLDEHGEPQHDAGVALNAPGLYFVGLEFQFAMSSSMLQGVARDAARVVEILSAQRARGKV